MGTEIYDCEARSLLAQKAIPYFLFAGNFFANDKDVVMTTSTAPILTIQIPLRLHKTGNFSKKKQIATSRIG